MAIFATDGIKGYWWKAKDGRKIVEEFSTVERAGRRLRIRRRMLYEYRVYMNRTDGSDFDVIGPDDLRLWNDPIEGKPHSAEDWMVVKASMKFDPDSGMVEITSRCKRSPVDWTSSKTISRKEMI